MIHVSHSQDWIVPLPPLSGDEEVAPRILCHPEIGAALDPAPDPSNHIVLAA
jgi:hypothetical protein